MSNAPKLIQKPNPLASYMRQPKIYIKLPSEGKYWPARAITLTENGEYPVYSMTAKDELMFKTPDALLNGQSIVDVIQSCIPAIKNAWECPTLDLDTILIAIRLATYGEKMPLSVKIPVTNEDIEYEIDLRRLLDQQQQQVTWDENVRISEDLVILVKPLTYKHMTQVSIKSFETRRIMQIVNDDTVSEEEKLKVFNSSFANLTQITVDLMSQSIFKILTPEIEVTDETHIKDFIANADKSLFESVKNHLDNLKNINEMPPMTIETTEEQRAEGAPESFAVPINFNNSDFFG
jgi:hypothetical protein